MHIILKGVSGLAGAALFVISATALAAPDCTCRYSGADFNVGSCTCMVISGELKRACCGRVLNNTSWNFNAGQCPVSDAPQSTVPVTEGAAVTADMKQQAALPDRQIADKTGKPGQ